MKMCHMLGDTIGELLQMADLIGLDRRLFQPWLHPHFDVSLGYRARAIKAGAILVDRRGIVKVMKAQRDLLALDGMDKAEFEAATAGCTKGRIAAIRQRDAQPSI
jgi:hypothetical protein|tara:strand:+ start:1978 stop:2292 length:315 start_codon:yes stop_codon:yes gene_type:complete